MPELPEVETVRRGLIPALEQQRIVEVVTRRDDLRCPLPEGFATRIAGRRVRHLERRAKYLLITLEGDLVLIIHLGMSGRMTVHPAGRVPPPERHDHVDFRTEAGTVVRYNDPRRFGLMDLVEGNDLAGHRLLVGLGPEPLSNQFSGPVLAAALAGRRTPLKAALLDQRVVAGLGNIYVSEALFEAGLSPRRLAHTVRGGRAEALASAIRSVLERAIAAGGSTLRDHRQTSGELGYFQHDFRVYDHAEAPCPRCHKTTIRRLVQSGRSTFFCPKCQR